MLDKLVVRIKDLDHAIAKQEQIMNQAMADLNLVLGQKKEVLHLISVLEKESVANMPQDN